MRLLLMVLRVRRRSSVGFVSSSMSSSENTARERVADGSSHIDSKGEPKSSTADHPRVVLTAIDQRHYHFDVS